MDNNKIKRIVAKEGLIILVFLGLFILSLFINSEWIMFFSFLGYPIFLLIRFIKWALGTLYPQFFVPWTQIESLTKEFRYEEALNLMLSIEKNNPNIEEHYRDDKSWNLLKKTCFKGMFMNDLYLPVPELLKQEKFNEAKGLCKKGLDFMLQNPNVFDITVDSLRELKKEIESQFKNLTSVKVGDLMNFRKEFIDKTKTSNQDSCIQFLLDFLITPSICDSQMNEAEKH